MTDYTADNEPHAYAIGNPNALRCACGRNRHHKLHQIVYDIPVLFQVQAANNEMAARHLAADIQSTGLVETSDYIESWHMPNHKDVDGSDAPVRIVIIPQVNPLRKENT